MVILSKDELIFIFKNITCTNITRGVFDHLALGVVCPKQLNNVNLDRTKLALAWTSSIFVLLT